MTSNQNLNAENNAPASRENSINDPEQTNAPPAETLDEPAQPDRSGVEIRKDPAPAVVRFKPTPLPKFDGNVKEYPAWRKTVLNIFQIDWHAFGYTDLRAFVMIFMALRGKARETASAFYEAGGVRGTNRPQDFIAYLDRCHLDITRREKAFNELRYDLKMREGQEWLSFFPGWINKSIEAYGADLNHPFKIVTLRLALTDDLQDRLAGLLLPQESFEEWVDRVGQIAQRLEEIELSSRRRGEVEDEEGANREERAEGRAAGRRRQRRAAAAPGQQRQANAAANNAAGATQRAEPPRRSEWKTPEQIARLQEQGLCFRCERRGCNTRICPLLPAINPTVPVVRAAEAPLPQAAAPVNQAQVA